MSESSQHLAQRLTDEGQKTLEYFRGLSAADWEKQVYTEGTCWHVRQVLAHFAAAEVAFHLLIQNIVAGGPGSPEDFDLNDYNERRVAKLHDLTVNELLDQFAESRQKTAEVVYNLQADDLTRTGRHPFLGMASLEDMIKLIYRHNQIHLRDIRKSIAG